MLDSPEKALVISHQLADSMDDGPRGSPRVAITMRIVKKIVIPVLPRWENASPLQYMPGRQEGHITCMDAVSGG